VLIGSLLQFWSLRTPITSELQSSLTNFVTGFAFWSTAISKSSFSKYLGWSPSRDVYKFTLLINRLEVNELISAISDVMGLRAELLMEAIYALTEVIKNDSF
jgi:hypothetical protein